LELGLGSESESESESAIGGAAADKFTAARLAFAPAMLGCRP
jgi:hypothetical protein